MNIYQMSPFKGQSANQPRACTARYVCARACLRVRVPMLACVRAWLRHLSLRVVVAVRPVDHAARPPSGCPPRTCVRACSCAHTCACLFLRRAAVLDAVRACVCATRYYWMQCTLRMPCKCCRCAPMHSAHALRLSAQFAVLLRRRDCTGCHVAKIAALHRWPSCTGGHVVQAAVLHRWP